jgi:hypothetical protein
MNFNEFYENISESFKSVFKSTIDTDILFDKTNPARFLIDITSESFIEPGLPEERTKSFLDELLQKIGIKNADLIPQTSLRGRMSLDDRPFHRYPDFGLKNGIFGEKGLLFEIEPIGRDLYASRDHGIPQALDWFRDLPGLVNKYNAVVTNFVDWYLIIVDPDSDGMSIIEKSVEEALGIILDVYKGKRRAYIQLKKENQIITKFYKEFKSRIDKIASDRDRSLRIEGIDPATTNEDQRVKYYRTIFSRLLFIKILLSWHMLPIDPIQEILDTEERNRYIELNRLFFDVFNKKDEERIDAILPRLRILPYLNGGLFRRIELENQYRDMHLSSGAIKDIWDMLSQYDFIAVKTRRPMELVGAELADDNTVNPEVLGYIFEMTIGSDRKATGAFYTREMVTSYISRNSISNLVISRLKQRLEEIKDEIGANLYLDDISDFNFSYLTPDYSSRIYSELLEILKKITVCDPACGSGAFLEMAGKEILDIYTKIYDILHWRLEYINEEDVNPADPRPFRDLYSLKRYIAQHNLYGVDINDSAIEICELRMWLWIVKPPVDYDVPDDYSLEPLPNIEFNLRVGDSLIGFTNLSEIHDATRDSTLTGAAFEELIKRKIEEKEQLVAEYYGMNGASLFSSIVSINDELKVIFDDAFRDKIKSKISVTTEIDPNSLSIDEILEKIAVDRPILLKIHATTNTAITNEQFKEIYGPWKRGLKGGRGTFKSGKFSISAEGDLLSRKGCEGVIQFVLNNLGGNITEISYDRFYREDDIKKINPLHWVQEFPSIMESGGFDVIIGNPPYVFTRGIFTLNEDLIKPIYKLLFLQEDRIRSGSLTTGKLNTFSLFVKRLKDIIKTEEISAYIIGNTILRALTYVDVRKFILENFEIQRIVDMGPGVFEGVTASTIIIFLRKIDEITDNQIDIFKLVKMESDTEDDGNDKELFDISFLHTINSEFFRNSILFLFDTYSSDLDHQRQAIMETNSVPLGELVEEIEEGIVCNLETQTTTDNSIKDARKFLVGKDFDRYKINYKDRYVIYMKSGEGKLHRARTEKLFESRKIITHRIGGGIRIIVAALDESGYYTFASVNNIIIKEDKSIPEEYILAVLNSKCLNWYFLKFTNASDLTVNVTKSFMEMLPIKIIQHYFRLFEEIVDITTVAMQNDSINTNALVEFLEDLVYDLYFGDNSLLETANQLPSLKRPLTSDRITYFIELIENDENINELRKSLASQPDVHYIEDIVKEKLSNTLDLSANLDVVIDEDADEENDEDGIDDID